MARTATAEIEIASTPAEIFPWLVEPARRLDWIEGCTEATPLTDGSVRVGSRWTELHHHGNREFSFELEITELEAPRLMKCSARAAGAFQSEVAYRISTGMEAGFATVEVAQTTRFEHWVMRLFGSMMAKGLGKKLAVDLQRLKEAVEAVEAE